MAETKAQTSSFKRLLSAYEQRNDSERRLIFWAVPGLILFIGFITYVEPVFIEISSVEKSIDRIQKQQLAFEDTKQELFAIAVVDPDKQTKLDIKQVEKRLASLEQKFDSELGQLVSPQAMPNLLGQLFEKAGSLKLQKMESIAPVQIFAEEGTEKQLFQHGIRITFEGGYVDTRDFLAKAEELGWKLYWRYLEYRVDEHPNATTELEVFTLSTSEAFIGVY